MNEPGPALPCCYTALFSPHFFDCFLLLLPPVLTAFSSLSPVFLSAFSRKLALHIVDQKEAHCVKSPSKPQRNCRGTNDSPNALFYSSVGEQLGLSEGSAKHLLHPCITQRQLVRHTHNKEIRYQFIKVTHTFM